MALVLHVVGARPNFMKIAPIVRALRADETFRGVPIVALTAHALEEEQQFALRAGFDQVIAKPCLPDELHRILVELLGRWRPDLQPL